VLRIYATYIQDQIDITKQLQVVGGVRFDRFDLDYSDNRTGLKLNQTNHVFSPRAGVIYKPQDNMSLYANYSESFLPSSGDQFATLTAQTQGLKPESIQNYEIGSKWDINPSLNVTAAIFQLDRTNTRATDPNNPTNFILTGESRTRGVELGATGHIDDQWQITGGYAYQDAVITSATTDARKGAKVGLVPPHMLSLWNKYDVTKEWAAALGIIKQSRQFATVDQSVKLKGYTRFDAAVFYTIKPEYRIQLNVENLFNKQYSQTAHNNNNIQPGSPQAFRVSLVANF
jgi:catecholate siderophore receptor